jgi:hypothetical protein
MLTDRPFCESTHEETNSEIRACHSRAASDDDVHLIRQGLTDEAGLHVRVALDELRQWTRHLNVLIFAVRPKPLVALLTVLLAQRVGIEIDGRFRDLVDVTHSFGPHIGQLPLMLFLHLNMFA